ncbi:MAG: hypothetical protein KAJ14_13620 [Candidatus Omnitrophica bacterium]|nr:hypothetical protein [Candidatus Omnitrophota bacterium]
MFLKGDFISFEVAGEHSKSVIAYARKLNDNCAITIVSRFFTKIIKETEYYLRKEIWKDTYIQLTEITASNIINPITLQRLQ